MNKKYPHINDYLYNTPWAILPEKLEEIQAVIFSRENQDIKLNVIPEKIEEKWETELKSRNSSNGYALDVTENGIAVIPVFGTLAKRMNLLMALSGGTSTEILQKKIQAALDDSKVKGILLRIDSPGGSAFGCFEASDFIYNARGKKPIIAYADGSMTSAAYLIGSAADKVIAYDTSLVGSIGVVSIHIDYSVKDKNEGIVKTVLTAGKYKGLGNSAEPLTKEGREYIQEELDYYYSLFVDAVARNRGVSVDDVLAMAEGKIFIGQQALDIGLVDEIGNFDLALSRAKVQRRKKTMELADLRAEHPQLVAALQEEAKKAGFDEGYQAGKEAGYEEGLSAGMEKERERITEIREICPKGQEELAEEYITKGMSVQEAMKGFLMAQKAEAEAREQAEDKLKQERLAQLQSDQDRVEPVTPIKEDKASVNSNLPVEKRAEQEWNQNPELREEFKLGGLPSYIAFLEAQEKGLTKIHSIK